MSNLARAVGWPSALDILSRRFLGRRAVRRVRVGDRKVTVRPCDSDLFVLGQIFGLEEYALGRYGPSLMRLAARWKSEAIQPVILDVGANIGLSSLYFAGRFDNCIVVAIEAEAKSYQILQANVGDHPRIRTTEAAVWSHENGVRFSQPDRFGSWGGRVESGEGLTPSLHLSSTYADIAGARPLIVKLDVEGSEKEICEQAVAVLREVPCILVEPHDFMLPGRAVLTPLHAILGQREMDTILRDEILMFFDSELTRM